MKNGDSAAFLVRFDSIETTTAENKYCSGFVTLQRRYIFFKGGVDRD